jgi:hypothetical protein
MKQREADLYGVDVRVFLPRIQHLKINVTYRCDRGCTNCNRATGLCPSSKKEDLSPKQIENMLNDCVKNNKSWTRITLTGGEPTMHENFEEIVDILMYYKRKYNQECNVGTYTYHHPKFYYKIENVMKKYPDFEVKDTMKQKARVHKIAQFQAPVDMEPDKYNKDHLYHGCNDGSRLCGLGYDITGFYCCPVGAAIARIFKLDVAIKTVAEITVKRLIEQYAPLCPKCGLYAYYKANVDKNLISPTWLKAIKEYNEGRLKK